MRIYAVLSPFADLCGHYRQFGHTLMAAVCRRAPWVVRGYASSPLGLGRRRCRVVRLPGQGSRFGPRAGGLRSLLLLAVVRSDHRWARIGVLHWTDGTMLVAVLSALIGFGRIRVVFHPWGRPSGGGGLRKVVWTGLVRALIRRGVLVVACETRSDAKAFRRCFGCRARVVGYCARWPAMPPWELARDRYAIDRERFVVLLFGSLRGDKDYASVADALEHFAGGRRPVVLVAGDYAPTECRPPTAAIERLLGLGDVVAVTRYLNPAQVAEVFAASDAVLLPYRAGGDGSGVLADAVAFDRPVLVSSAASALAARVEAEGWGLRYQPDDPRWLELACDRLRRGDIRKSVGRAEPSASQRAFEREVRNLVERGSADPGGTQPAALG